MPGLQVHHLGDFRVTYDGALVTTVVQPRLQALLARKEVKRFKPDFSIVALLPYRAQLECGGCVPGSGSRDKVRIMTSNTPDLVPRHFPDSWEARFAKADRAI